MEMLIKRVRNWAFFLANGVSLCDNTINRGLLCENSWRS